MTILKLINLRRGANVVLAEFGSMWMWQISAYLWSKRDLWTKWDSSALFKDYVKMAIFGINMWILYLHITQVQDTC